MSTPVLQQPIQSTIKQPQYNNLKVINPEDYQKWKQSREKIIIAPVVFCTGISVLFLLGKRVKLAQLISNPLKTQPAFQTTSNRWNFLIKHSIIFGTLAVAAGAYFKKEFNKYMIFKEYERQVNFYMRWKIENQIVGFINEEKQMTDGERIQQAGRV